jgi:hypothetical protein
LSDLKNLTFNELSLKHFSTKPEINDLETKYNQIVKSNLTNAYNIYINENRKAFVEKHPGTFYKKTLFKLMTNKLSKILKVCQRQIHLKSWEKIGVRWD